MATIKTEIRSGAYYDSVILMQLQQSLAALPGILDTGVVMGTAANKDILAQTDLLVPEAQAAASDDLIIVLRAEDEAAAAAALAQVDQLLTRKRSTAALDYRPKSLEAAAEMLPDAQWVLISVPGRYAGGLAREALRLGKNVFLFSDNVSLEDEVSLKQMALEKGLLVMGPDCGTAIVNGVGLGFANRVRRGPIGMVAASGTGLQQVSSRIHQLGSGMTHALGTGGRDLSEAVGAVTAHQGLDFFSRDPETKVIVLVSKPPAPKVAEDLLRAARSAGKPVVVDFIGYTPPAQRLGNLHFVRTFDQAAALAVELAQKAETEPPEPALDLDKSPISNLQSPISNLQSPISNHQSPISNLQFAPSQKYLRGLFSGGTLAYEALLILQDYLPAVYSNAPLKKGHNVLQNSLVSQENTIVDLGEDEFTVGRLHPMLDNALRLQSLQQEADDPQVAVILLDVVLGYGAHPDPASELAPAIAAAIAQTKEAGRHLEVVAVVVGTDQDPQGLDKQIEQLKAAGVWVDTRNDVAVRYAGQLIQALSQPAPAPADFSNSKLQTPISTPHSPLSTLQSPTPTPQSPITNLQPPISTPQSPISKGQAVDLDMMKQPLAGLNVGLESFAESIKEQDAVAIHVDWRPPASGNEKLAAILERMKKK